MRYVSVGRGSETSIAFAHGKSYQRLLDSSPGRQHGLYADTGIQWTSALNILAQAYKVARAALKGLKRCIGRQFVWGAVAIS